jgi:hypothetical protein
LTLDPFRVAAAAALAFAAAGVLAQAAPSVFELSLVDGRVRTASDTLRVRKGEPVELRWSSDRPTVLHLHGYDIERKVLPQSPAVMSFTADIAGRFPVSEHGRGGRHGRAVVYLEVHP